MLPLLKKSSPKREASQDLAWHPDFRIRADLPDTKAVRTMFFLSTASVSVFTALLIFIAQREYNLAVLQDELRDTEAKIQISTGENAKLVKAYGLYQTEEKKFSEAQEFVKHSFRLTDFMVLMGEIIPSGIKVTKIDFKGINQNLMVSITVNGVDAGATDAASNYIKLLREDKQLTKHFSGITLAKLNRNTVAGNLNVELSLAFIKTTVTSVKPVNAKKP
jgi:hypothetical protein